MEKFDEERRSQAERRKTLFKKEQQFLRSKRSLTEFQEPIGMMIRRTGRVEFYENVTTGKLTFTHTDGEERYITILPNQKLQFDYAGKTFSGYICHEDFPFPLPENPVLTNEMYGISLEKVLSDIRKWKAEEWKAKGDYWWKILLGLAVIIAAYALFKMLTVNPSDAASTVTTIVQNMTGEPAIQNATVFG